MISIKRLIFLFILLASSVTVRAAPNPSVPPVVRYSHEKTIQLNKVSVSDDDEAEILTLIKACADIAYYDAQSTDINELMKKVLFSYRNFMLLTDKAPELSQQGNSSMISGDYVEDIMHKAFRIKAPQPEYSQLTVLRYCHYRGRYYFLGGYRNYFATDVKNILAIFLTNDNDLYVVFRNTYTEGSAPPSEEYSTAVVSYDNDGYYLKALHMDTDFSDLPDYRPVDNKSRPSPLVICIILFAVLISIGFLIYFMIF